MNTVREFIETALFDNFDIFKSQAVKDGLDRYRQQYEQYEKTNDNWNKNKQSFPDTDDGREKLDEWLKNNPIPCPSLLLIDVRNNEDKNAIALSAAFLCALHDFFYTSRTPIIPQNWPDNLKHFLDNQVRPKYEHIMLNTNDAIYWKNQFIFAMDTIKRAASGKAGDMNWPQGKEGQGSGGKADLPNSIPTKIWAMLCKLYEITLKVIVDSILDRFWPKPQ